MQVRLTTLALLLATVLQDPANGHARLDATAAARAECERKLGIPQIAGSGDPVREQQIAACVQQSLRERQTRQPR